MNTPKSQTEKILKGCGESECYYEGEYKGQPLCGKVKGNLCPTCQAQAKLLLEVYKEEVNFLDGIIICGFTTDGEMFKELAEHNKLIEDRISELKSCIERLE